MLTGCCCHGHHYHQLLLLVHPQQLLALQAGCQHSASLAPTAAAAVCGTAGVLTHTACLQDALCVHSNNHNTITAFTP